MMRRSLSNTWLNKILRHLGIFFFNTFTHNVHKHFTDYYHTLDCKNMDVVSHHDFVATPFDILMGLILQLVKNAT